MARVRPAAADADATGVPSLLNVGYGNLVAAARVVALTKYEAARFARRALFDRFRRW